MGFHNPITSVSDVDTGLSPTGPGVRLYQDISGEFPRGVLEMRDGVDGDAHATLTSVAYLVAQYDVDGNVIGYTSVGRSTVLSGGSNNLVDAPDLELIVQEAAAGGYEAVARLKSTRTEVTGLMAFTGGTQGRVVIPAAFIANSPTGSSWVIWPTTDYEKLTFTQLPDGLIHVSGAVKYTGTAGLASPDICGVVGAFLPKYGHEMLSANVNGTYHGRDF